MTIETKNDLQKHVEYIAKEISSGTFDCEEAQEEGREPSAYDYLSDVLEIQYLVDSNKEYLSARILVSFGGPNIWIDTRSKKVEGYWWGDYEEAGFTDEIGLNDACEDIFSC